MTTAIVVSAASASAGATSRDRSKREQAEISKETPEALRSPPIGTDTTVRKALAAINADSMLKTYQDLAALSDQDKAELASLRQDLNLDSLTLLEISVDVDLAFKLELQDERYREIDSLPGMVALVRERLAELAAAAAQPEAVPG